jgi:Tn3 transposase DDE domain
VKPSNSASRAIFVGQRGEFRDRVYQDQVHRASCLHLLVAEGEDVRDELIAHLSPVAWSR